MKLDTNAERAKRVARARAIRDLAMACKRLLAATRHLAAAGDDADIGNMLGIRETLRFYVIGIQQGLRRDRCCEFCGYVLPEHGTECPKQDVAVVEELVVETD